MLGDPPSWGLSPITGLHPPPGPDRSHPKWGGEENINYILNIGRGGWENRVVHAPRPSQAACPPCLCACSVPQAARNCLDGSLTLVNPRVNPHLTHLITSSQPHLTPLQTLAHGLGIQPIQGVGQKVWARRSRGRCMPITLRWHANHVRGTCLGTLLLGG